MLQGEYSSLWAITSHAILQLLSLALIIATVCLRSISKDSSREVFTSCSGAKWSIFYLLCVHVYTCTCINIFWCVLLLYRIPVACVAVPTKWGFEELFDCECSKHHSFEQLVSCTNNGVSVSKKNQRSVDQLIKYMIDVAMGMHYIMERGLVHRVSYVKHKMVSLW